MNYTVYIIDTVSSRLVKLKLNPLICVNSSKKVSFPPLIISRNEIVFVKVELAKTLLTELNVPVTAASLSGFFFNKQIFLKIRSEGYRAR